MCVWGVFACACACVRAGLRVCDFDDGRTLGGHTS